MAASMVLSTQGAEVERREGGDGEFQRKAGCDERELNRRKLE